MQYYDNALDCLEHLEDGLDERVFYFIAKLDDVSEADDPRKWIKANPNIGLMSFVDLVTDWKTERNSPQERADWITKQFNLFQILTNCRSWICRQSIRTIKKLIGKQ